MRRLGTVLSAAALISIALVAAGCGDQTADPGDASAPEDATQYASEYAAPDRSAYTGDDLHPEPDVGMAELTTDDGMRVVIWIDPDDIRLVKEQHSPTADAGEWSEPALLHTAGDGCLAVHADTEGSTVAATLACYQTDAWEQQAPNEGMAAVTTDLTDWELYEPDFEFYGQPTVTSGSVVWSNDGTEELEWSPGSGFSALGAT